LAAASALFLGLWRFTPPDASVCGFHWLTGRPCPLCGLTHALCALAKGQIGLALYYHPLAPLGAVMLLSLFRAHPGRARLWTAGLAAFAVYGVWRMF
jgi:hypothetical protein